jgi:hypothetical protein
MSISFVILKYLENILIGMLSLEKKIIFYCFCLGTIRNGTHYNISIVMKDSLSKIFIEDIHYMLIYSLVMNLKYTVPVFISYKYSSYFIFMNASKCLIQQDVKVFM